MSNYASEDEYIYVDEAAEILGVGDRQVNYYGHEDPPKIRTKRSGKHVLYHKGDVLRLAQEKKARERKPKPPRPQVMQAGQYLELIRNLEDQLAQTRQQLGYYQGLLEQRLLPDDERNLRQRVYDLEQQRHDWEIEKLQLQHQLELARLRFEHERERLQRELDATRRPPHSQEDEK